MRIFGIDPGSERTGYGCVETDGRRHTLVMCGAITAVAADPFPQRLARIHRELSRLLAVCRPDCVAIENLFYATNVRSALKLGHARGVTMIAAVEAGCSVVEYTPAEIKRAVVGYGRAEKHQVQLMVKLLLGLEDVPSPHDAADALAVAICHMHSMPPPAVRSVATVRLKADTTNNNDKTDVVSGFSRTVADDKTIDHQTDVVSGFSRTAAGDTTIDHQTDVVSGFSRTVGGRISKARTWRQYRPPANG